MPVAATGADGATELRRLPAKERPAPTPEELNDEGAPGGGKLRSFSGSDFCNASSRAVGCVGSTHDCTVGSQFVPVGSLYFIGLFRP